MKLIDKQVEKFRFHQEKKKEYEGCKIPCDRACSWVVDYVKFKEIKSKYKID